jgi:hypothetical protein
MCMNLSEPGNPPDQFGCCLLIISSLEGKSDNNIDDRYQTYIESQLNSPNHMPIV